MTFNRIIPYPVSPSRHIGGGDFKRAWTAMSGLSVRATPTATQFPARLHGIDENGFQSQVQFHIPMVPELLEELAQAFLDLAGAIRKAEELRAQIEDDSSTL